MIRRIWAGVCTALAVVAVFAVLAVTHRQPTTSASANGPVVLVRSAGGTLVPVTVASGGVHATTQTSPAAGGSAGQGANGGLAAVTAPTQPTTRSS
jgi:hypothetical protein